MWFNRAGDCGFMSSDSWSVRTLKIIWSLENGSHKFPSLRFISTNYQIVLVNRELHSLCGEKLSIVAALELTGHSFHPLWTFQDQCHFIVYPHIYKYISPYLTFSKSYQIIQSKIQRPTLWSSFRYLIWPPNCMLFVPFLFHLAKTMTIFII
jgi:hypothetical protein